MVKYGSDLRWSVDKEANAFQTHIILAARGHRQLEPVRRLVEFPETSVQQPAEFQPGDPGKTTELFYHSKQHQRYGRKPRVLVFQYWHLPADSAECREHSGHLAAQNWLNQHLCHGK